MIYWLKDVLPSKSISFLFKVSRSKFHALPLLMFIQAEDEIVDPTPAIRKGCLGSCPKQLSLYKACVDRITAKGEGDCEAWFLDLVTCMDKCIAPKLFDATKE